MSWAAPGAPEQQQKSAFLFGSLGENSWKSPAGMVKGRNLQFIYLNTHAEPPECVANSISHPLIAANLIYYRYCRSWAVIFFLFLFILFLPADPGDQFCHGAELGFPGSV